MFDLDHGFEAEVLVPSEDADYGYLNAADQRQGLHVLVLLAEDQVLLLPCQVRLAGHLLQHHLQALQRSVGLLQVLDLKQPLWNSDVGVIDMPMHDIRIVLHYGPDLPEVGQHYLEAKLIHHVCNSQRGYFRSAGILCGRCPRRSGRPATRGSRCCEGPPGSPTRWPGWRSAGT